MAKTTLWLRDWAASDIVAPASGDALFLLGITYTPSLEGQRAIDVYGVTFGSATVDVTVEVGATTATTAATVTASGQFSAQLLVACAPSDESGIVSASNADASATGQERAAFAFRDAGMIELPPHTTYLIEPRKLEYTPGAPDRLQYSRTFVKVETEPPWGLLLHESPFFEVADGAFVGINRAIFANLLQKPTIELLAAVEANRITLGQYHRALRELIRESIAAALVRVPDEMIARIKKQSEERKRWRQALMELDRQERPQLTRRAQPQSPLSALVSWVLRGLGISSGPQNLPSTAPAPPPPRPFIRPGSTSSYKYPVSGITVIPYVGGFLAPADDAPPAIDIHPAASTPVDDDDKDANDGGFPTAPGNNDDEDKNPNDGGVHTNPANDPTTHTGPAIDDYIDEALDCVAAYRRLGIMFYERTRIRPTNQIFGEPIFQLALTPGEEVQIRQTTETKRRTALLEIQDRESERETSFSSTWSTDMASTISSQTSFQQTTNIGADVSGEVPEVPVEVSADVATSVNTADTSSAQDSVNQRRERTETATARMRQQHRVQIELAVEENQSFGTTRTLRNFNQQRSMLHTFFKVYRKEQVTLERYDGRLCLRLTVTDPARTTRAAFLAGLGKIDPEVLAWENVTPLLPDITKGFCFTVTAPDDDGGLAHGTKVDRCKTRELNLRSETGVDSDYVLSRQPKFVMTKCHLAFYKDVLTSTDPDNDFDPDVVPESQLSQVPPNFWVGWSFIRNGGTVQFSNGLDIDSEDTLCRVKLNLPLFWTAPSILGEKEMEIASVRFHVETAWGPSDQARADYLNRVNAERLRLRADFSAEQVYELHAVAETDYPHAVLDHALSENLTYPPEFEYRQVKEMFDLENVIIDNIPYWAHSGMRQEHDELMLRLQRLPAHLVMSRLLTDCLTASQAVVYLPVKPGMEEQALHLLPEADKYAEKIADSYRHFRATHYGRLKPFVPPTLAAHMGPAPTLPSPPDAADWANDWERVQNKFDILGQWAELVPTDGVHVETHLSTTAVADEHERNRLIRITATND
ncbi:MAG TPA: hypothetical protein VGX92_13910 [Pyrinomonadaceae bacterium]|jgi:hypothetical protein|nr:hypothetical protein [Pyrinomonadaceae bacterium]